MSRSPSSIERVRPAGVSCPAGYSAHVVPFLGDPDVAFLAPTGAPRVLDSPELLAFVSDSVANDERAVLQVVTSTPDV